VYVNRAAAGATGDFDTTSNFDISGNAYYADTVAGADGRFSDAPKGNVSYANGNESMIFGGDEQAVAACFSATDDGEVSPWNPANPIDFTNAVNNNDTSDFVTLQAAGTETLVIMTTRPIQGVKVYITGTPVTTVPNMYYWDGSAWAAVSNLDYSDTEVDSDPMMQTGWLTFDHTKGSVKLKHYEDLYLYAYLLETEHYYPATAPEPAVGEGDVVAGDVGSCRHKGDSDIYQIEEEGGVPGQDFHFTFANINMDSLPTKIGVNARYEGSAPHDVFIYMWDYNGSAWVRLTAEADDFPTAGALADFSFDVPVVNPEYYFETGAAKIRFYHPDAGTGGGTHNFYIDYLELTGVGDIDIYGITVDPAFQNIENVWDGVYRQPVQLQVKDTAASAYKDYTAQGNVESEEVNPVGVKLTTFADDGDFIIMFNEKMSAIRLQMLGSLLNVVGTSVITLKYWNGSAWVAVSTQVDGSSGFEQTGLISWIPADAEKPQTLFNTFGYAYQITVDVTINPVSTNCYIDIVSGIPALVTMPGYDFAAQYGTRLMQCAPSILNEGNRIDFSVANAPDVYNGIDASDDGHQSLYFGGDEKITAAAPLYNRFGSNILSMFLVLKDAETYLLVGTGPDDFVIYPVSKTIGCPAPLTLSVGEVDLTTKNTQEGATRNMAVWLSASGPVMFDGASITTIKGIDNYFNPNKDEYVEWDVISRCRGWVDTVHKEYNLLMPSGSGETDNNKWLVYDLRRRKWYEKKTGTLALPQAAWEVVGTNGERFNYAGVDTGYVMYLENGTSWDGTGITQRVKTGDFFPSSDIWDETIIRKFKLLTHKFEDVSASNNLAIYYYKNTAESIGSGVAFIDVADGFTGTFVNFTDAVASLMVSGTDQVVWAATSAVSININKNIGSRRIINIVTDHNKHGWAHAWEFVITTTDVVRGFRPIAWGVQYKVERKDNKATE